MLKVKSGIPISKLELEAYRLYPDKEAIYDGYRRVTYKELHEEVQLLASGLKQLGIEKGDRVAVGLPNWHEFIVIMYAVAKLGAILVPLNTRYRQNELETILLDSGAKLAFFTKEFNNINHSEQFKEALTQIDQLKQIISVRYKTEGITTYEQLMESGKYNDAPEIDIDPEEDVFLICYTSGTTGNPKGVVLTHNALIYNATCIGERMRLSSNDVIQIPSPFSHIHGITTSLQAVATKGKMVLMENFSAGESLRLIEEEHISVKCGVPTMYILELNHPNFKNTNTSSLRTGNIVGAPCPIELMRQIKKEMGCDILVGYGMTEGGPGVTNTSFEDSDEIKSETVGTVNPGLELKIVDDQGQEVQPGNIGEIAVRGISVMKGYYNQSELTGETLDSDGWFYSGDLGTKDSEGYVRIVGRKKEMIIRGGFNIYPREIEEIYHTHPSVMDVAIVGLPDTVLGEVTCAAIILKPGYTSTEQEMKKIISDQVADYKVPNHIIFVDELPTTTSGKVIKTNLQKKLVDENLVALR